MTADRPPVVWGAVVVAAGGSERFGQDNKLLQDILGTPVIARAVQALASDPRVRELVLVTASNAANVICEAVSASAPEIDIRQCIGGASRSESVSNGLAALSSSVTHVAVHDGARPLVPVSVVRSVLDEAEVSGAAVPVLPPSSTIAVVSHGTNAMAGVLDRSRLCEVQTPQAARRFDLQAALASFPNETDESTALFRAGHRVSFVPGSPVNIKITLVEDLAIARALAEVQDGTSR